MSYLIAGNRGLSDAEQRVVSSFMDVGAGERRTLADIIMEKVSSNQEKGFPDEGSCYLCMQLICPPPLHRSGRRRKRTLAGQERRCRSLASRLWSDRCTRRLVGETNGSACSYERLIDTVADSASKM